MGFHLSLTIELYIELDFFQLRTVCLPWWKESVLWKTRFMLVWTSTAKINW